MWILCHQYIIIKKKREPSHRAGCQPCRWTSSADTILCFRVHLGRRPPPQEADVLPPRKLGVLLPSLSDLLQKPEESRHFCLTNVSWRRCGTAPVTAQGCSGVRVVCFGFDYRVWEESHPPTVSPNPHNQNSVDLAAQSTGRRVGGDPEAPEVVPETCSRPRPH